MGVERRIVQKCCVFLGKRHHNKILKVQILSSRNVCCHGAGSFQGKTKHININKCAGLSRDCVGGKCLFMCFFFFSLWGRKTHKQNPPQILGQSSEHFGYVFFSLCAFFFFRSQELRQCQARKRHIN